MFFYLTFHPQLEECSLLDFDAYNPAQFFYTTFLACYLLKGDLDSAKYLWKRAPQPWKSSSSGTFLAEMWEVGKALWNGDTSVALINLSIQWPSELHFMVEKLKAAVELNVLKTVQLSYNCISIENLAQRLNISPAGLILSTDI